MESPAEMRLYQQTRRADLASLSVIAARLTENGSARQPEGTEEPLQIGLRQVREALAREYADLLRDRVAHREAILTAIRDKLQATDLTSDERHLAYELLSTDYFGFGRLDRYMADPNVTEIIVDSPSHVDVEVGGQLHRVPVSWRSDEDLREYIKGLIRDTGRPLDTAHPIVDCEVGGARVNATSPPVSKHFTLNIRKSTEQTRRYTAEEYIRSGAINLVGMRLLLSCARGAATILACGATGSGKTTLARILIEMGARDDLRWIVLEDVRETEAHVERFVSLQTVERKENPITVDDLFATTKRKRPDRIAVGEVRSGDHAAPFILSTLAGHEGPITTLHAGNEYDAVFNFIFFLKMSGLPVAEDFLERMLHRQLNILVFVRRFRDGRRRVTRIVEVLPMGQGNDGFQVLMEWDKATDQLVWRNPISNELAYRLDLNETVVPTPDDDVTWDNYLDLDTFAETPPVEEVENIPAPIDTASVARDEDQAPADKPTARRGYRLRRRFAP